MEWRFSPPKLQQFRDPKATLAGKFVRQRGGLVMRSRGTNEPSGQGGASVHGLGLQNQVTVPLDSRSAAAKISAAYSAILTEKPGPESTREIVAQLLQSLVNAIAYGQVSDEEAMEQAVTALVLLDRADKTATHPQEEAVVSKPQSSLI